MKTAIFNPDVELAWYREKTPVNLHTTFTRKLHATKKYGITNNNRHTDPIGVDTTYKTIKTK